MDLTRRTFSALATMAAISSTARGQTAAPFRADWDSLIANYCAPDWFRDAKLGFWAHWSAQCVPEQGDWYARNMYIQGHPQYDHHVATYGHPCDVGFMEMNNLWKAEHWNPEALMKRYVKAGAKYFVALANHHDNFDNYNSKYHAWNSVKIGPKKDLVGIWAKIARNHGLKFGVTNHSTRAWHWFQTAYGYDAEGVRMGQRYDAYRLTKADGAGKWWNGLDPQLLYTGRNLVPPDGLKSVAEMNDWYRRTDHNANDGPPPNNPGFTELWRARCLDLIDSYRPDLLYFDNFDLPLGQAGLDVAAHYYNTSAILNGGIPQCVLNIKSVPAERKTAVVEDVERGFHADIMPTPWQTDTCIGEWHYRRSIYDQHRYKTVEWVVHALCDIVSKNGNLLLNIPLRGDGSIDPDEEAFLDSLAAWVQINGDAIFATRPWRVFGEGPSRTTGGNFNENRQVFTGADIRFTQKNGALYALVLGWPDGGQANITALANGAASASGGVVERVDLLGSGAPLSFHRDSSALQVVLPESRRGDIAYALKIQGRGLS